MNVKPKRAVAYIRVSQEREDMISPELQETAIREHCRRMGYELVETLTDLDLSGRFWKRRQVERAVGMIEAREVEVIVVWKMSRVARNRLDWNIALDRVETAGGRLESATEPMDVTTSSGRFSRGILAELAAFESERAGEQWQETHRRRWSRGLPHNGKPRFGYQYDRERGFVIDPESAEVVREVFTRYNSGQGLGTIAAWLNTLGLDTAPSTIRGVASFLRTGFAAGYMTHHDPECQGPHSPNVRCMRLVTVRGVHEPIIDQQTYEITQRELAQRATMPPRLISPVSSLSGIVICTSCEHRMARNGRKGVPPYFRCTNQFCTAPTTVQEKRAEAAVTAWLPTVAAEVTAAAMKEPRSPAKVRAGREKLELAAARAETALTKLTIDYARGMIPDAAYAGARTALEAERDDAARVAASMRSQAAVNVERGVIVADLIETWDAMSAAARNRILRHLCVVRVTRGPWRPTLEVVPLWEIVAA